MKIKILQEKLKEAVSCVEKITGKDTTLPILGNILLKAQKNSLYVVATNLETGISWNLLAKTEEEGSIVLPAQTFLGLINSLPGSMVAIESQKNSISIVDGKIKSNLNGLSDDEFPILPIDDNGDCFTVRADLLCQALSCVVNFTGSSSVKPEITGVYAVFEQNCVKVVATDSFRLGEKILSVSKQSKLSKNHSIIIPTKAVKEIISIFGDKQKNINIYFTNNQIMVDLSDDGDLEPPRIQFVSRLIDGDFPDYQAIIPTSYAASVGFSKKEILDYLKPAGLFAGKNSEVVFNVLINDKTIKISSQSPDLGGYESELKLGSATGKNVSIVFNCRFLIDGLNVIKGDMCVFEFSGDDGPGVLKSTESQDFVYIIMPIKKY